MVTWQLQQGDDSAYDIYYLSIIDNNVGYASGHGIFKTTNGGGAVTGINQNIPPIKSLKIYPNPTKGNIHLEYGSDVQIKGIQLMDISGRIIKTFKVSEKMLNVAGIPGGLYNLKVTTTKDILNEKISLY